ncbi:MAG: aspartate carbamoyltransferase, partial [Ardenticatenaceae bacterium]
TANDPSDEEQIGLIQAHLEEITQEFQEGNFSDPAQIHGHEMPGLDDLRAGASRIEITYSALPDGGQIRYRTEEPDLINAIHHWFMAQLSDHGQHASDN